MTGPELAKWLEDVRAVAKREGERWRACRQPGDLKLDTWTSDRVRLHAVGEFLGRIEAAARLAEESVNAMRPKTIAVVFDEVTTLTDELKQALLARTSAGPKKEPPCVGHARKPGDPLPSGSRCCARAGDYSGFGSDGPTIFVCPKGCSCHD